MADRARQHGSFVPCLVTIYLCLPRVLSFSVGGLSIYPEGRILVRRGEALEMFCTTDCSADDIQFLTIGSDTVVPSEKINDTTIRVNTKMDVNGVYSFYCTKTKDCNGRRRMVTTRVLVDEAPHNVTDFQCVSYNLDELKCAWKDYGSVSRISRSLFIIVNGRKSDPCVAVRSDFTSYYCTWHTTSLPRYRQLEKQFMFSLTSSNAFGSNEQNFTVDHYSIVQPARIMSLKVLEMDTYSATLHWKIPHNMIDLLPNGVVHKIEYQIANIDNSSVFLSVDASSLPKKNYTYRFDLSLPYAHMQYVVKVSIRPVKASGEQYWSEPSVVTFYTKGKSTGEIAAVVYKNWRKNMNEVPQAFSSKLWHVKAEKHLNDIWPPKERATLALMSVLHNGNRISENGHKKV